MSQSELADRIPLSQKQVSRIERGLFVQLPRRTLVRLAEVLSVPLVTGEVNDWLLQSGYAPLIRPDLPLPPRLDEWLATSSSHPVAVMDPAGTVRYANPLFDRLWSAQCRHTDNLVLWVLDKASPLETRDRLRLLRWHLGVLRYAAGEPWTARFRETVLSQDPDVGALWERAGRHALAPADLSGAPVRVAHARYGVLAFRVAVSEPFWRPDLQILMFHPHDHRTRTWCHEGRTPLPDLAADLTDRSG